MAGGHSKYVDVYLCLANCFPSIIAILIHKECFFSFHLGRYNDVHNNLNASPVPYFFPLKMRETEHNTCRHAEPNLRGQQTRIIERISVDLLSSCPALKSLTPRRSASGKATEPPPPRPTPCTPLCSSYI